MPTIAQLLREISAVIERSGHAARPRREAEDLVGHRLGVDRAHLFAHPEQALSAQEVRELLSMASRRARGEPLSYVTGHAEFCGRTFVVTPAVLIPRPETEMIVARACGIPSRRTLDVGTGSGVLAITLALQTDAKVTATDLSSEALLVARRNASRLRASVALIRGDGAGCLGDARFDLVVANPPYVDPSDRLPIEVRGYEPPLALFSVGGLSHLAIWIPEAERVLAPGGRLLFEIGYGQEDGVRAIVASQSGLAGTRIHPDDRGIPRVLEAIRA